MANGKPFSEAVPAYRSVVPISPANPTVREYATATVLWLGRLALACQRDAVGTRNGDARGLL